MLSRSGQGNFSPNYNLHAYIWAAAVDKLQLNKLVDFNCEFDPDSTLREGRKQNVMP